MFTRAGMHAPAKWNMDKKEIGIILVAERDADFNVKFPVEIATIKSSLAVILHKSKYGEKLRYISLKKERNEQFKFSLSRLKVWK